VAVVLVTGDCCARGRRLGAEHSSKNVSGQRQVKAPGHQLAEVRGDHSLASNELCDHTAENNLTRSAEPDEFAGNDCDCAELQCHHLKSVKFGQGKAWLKSNRNQESTRRANEISDCFESEVNLNPCY